MYQITLTPQDHLIELVMSGFLSLEEVHCLFDEEQRRARDISPPDGGHGLLVDVTGLCLQSQDVFTLFQRLLNAAPCPARRIALLTGLSIARMQARRLSDSPRIATFRNRTDALAWLGVETESDNVSSSRTAA